MVLRANPTASFVVRFTLLSIAWLTISLPVLVPKYLYRESSNGGTVSSRSSARVSTNFSMVRNKNSPGSSDGVGFRTKLDQAGAQDEPMAGKSEWGQMQIKRLLLPGIEQSITGSSQQYSGARQTKPSVPPASQGSSLVASNPDNNMAIPVPPPNGMEEGGHTGAIE